MTTQMYMPWLKTITQINPAKELHDLLEGAYLAYDRDEDEDYGHYLEYEELALKYLMDVLQISVPIEYDPSEDLAYKGLEGYYYVVEAIFQHVHRLRKADDIELASLIGSKYNFVVWADQTGHPSGMSVCDFFIAACEDPEIAQRVRFS